MFKGKIKYHKFLIIFVNAAFIYTGNSLQMHYESETSTSSSSNDQTPPIPTIMQQSKKRSGPQLLPIATDSDPEGTY